MRARHPIALAALAALLLGGLPAAPAAAARRPPLEIALQDDAVFVNQAWLGRERALRLARQLNVSWVRINLAWAQVLGRQARRRTVPRRLVWNWAPYDALIDAAAARGIRVQIALTGNAPAFATRRHRISNEWPSAAQYGRFAAAAARHFKGRVLRYAIWNEPNYSGWLSPQRDAARLYRQMYLAAYKAIRRADPRAQILIGETAPYYVRNREIPPLQFLRDLTCVDSRWHRRRGCQPLIADGYAHHPYHYQHAPSYRYPGADNVTIGTLDRLVRALSRLARLGALRTPRGYAPPIYLTEFGYFTYGYRYQPPRRRGRYLAQAFEIAARNPHVRQLLQYQLAAPPPRTRWRTYIVTHHGFPTPAFTALRAWSAKAARQRRIAVPSGPLALPAAPPPGH